MGARWIGGLVKVIYLTGPLFSFSREPYVLCHKEFFLEHNRIIFRNRYYPFTFHKCNLLKVPFKKLFHAETFIFKFNGHLKNFCKLYLLGAI